jgi:hypothetical protein
MVVSGRDANEACHDTPTKDGSRIEVNLAKIAQQREA